MTHRYLEKEHTSTLMEIFQIIKFWRQGKQVGRTQSEYNEVTHFNINGGK